MNLNLSTEVTYIKGVGPQRAAVLAKRGILTVGDLLGYFPFRYEDRIHFSRIAEVKPGGTYTILGVVSDCGLARFARGRGGIFHVLLQDGTATLPLKFYHGEFLEGRLRAGQRLIVHGKADIDPRRGARLEMINPTFEVIGAAPPKSHNGNSATPHAPVDDPSHTDAASADAVNTDSTEAGRIVPVYEAIEGISSRTIRRMVHTVLDNLTGSFADPLPAEILERYHFPARRDALRFVHFPPSDIPVDTLNEFRSPAHQRLIFEEFFFYQLSMALRREHAHQQTGIAFRVREPQIRDALKRILPFKPTDAQKRVLAEIAADLERPAPMNRLLEGDVGSGKTIVALEAAAIVIENGWQVALMAPTEILAVQHFLSARRIFAPAGYSVELFTSGLKPADKRAAADRVLAGKAQIIVGTHALLEDPITFSKLGLVIVDEQHRFGVLQRKRLMEKGVTPDVLVMTATPIPRTLALTLFGDLDISVIDQMPPGRRPIETRCSTPEHLPGVWDFLRREVLAGRQGYVVYPVIEESKSATASRSLKAAIVEYERLQKTIFPQFRIGLLHGRMRSDEREKVMEGFRKGTIHILVSTTVIEVGVDVPNATVMIIEHAERFGLAQLHQLRGRIGRGGEKSTCMLIAPSLAKMKKTAGESRSRIEAMLHTQDGFAIAEIDLKLRGPGEFFGTRQHGSLGLQVANPVRDHELLGHARREALALVENPEALAARRRLLAGLAPEWQRRYQLASVG